MGAARPVRLVSARDLEISPRRIGVRTALLSLDLETDYGTGRSDALRQLPRLLDLAASLDVPLTAFVEGRLFERERAECVRLVEHGVDVQLHVYDHSTPGDTAESLRRGFEACASFLGRPPEGYRAHTYRLTAALVEALVECGFGWDSSLMRGLGLGRNADPAFRRGDYFVLGHRLVEFPIGTWRGARLPLNHPYTLLAGSAGGLALRRACGPSGSLVAYNVHMTDLVRSPALSGAPYGRTFEWLQRWMWLGAGRDSFGALASMCTYLRGRGFRFATTAGLFREVGGPAVGAAARCSGSGASPAGDSAEAGL